MQTSFKAPHTCSFAFQASTMSYTHNGFLSFSGAPPSLPMLLRLKLHQQVHLNYLTFGIFLLNDRTGSRVKFIEEKCSWDPQRIMVRVLQEWLEGKGLPVTWESLIQTLRDTDLSVLADQIQATKLSPH